MEYYVLGIAYCVLRIAYCVVPELVEGLRIAYSDSYVTIEFRVLACYCFARSPSECLGQSASGREALFRPNRFDYLLATCYSTPKSVVNSCPHPLFLSVLHMECDVLHFA